MQIARKITIGGINGLSGGFKNVTEVLYAARIYGRANGFEAKDGGSMGISYAFKGEFIGVNADGEETSAPQCFLISPADTLLVQALKDAEGAPVEFAFDFYVSPKETAILGYEYKVKSVLEVQKSQPLLSLTSKFADNPGPQKKQLALPGAGEVVTKAEADAAPEPEAAAPTGKKKN